MYRDRATCRESPTPGVATQSLVCLFANLVISIGIRHLQIREWFLRHRIHARRLVHHMCRTQALNERQEAPTRSCKIEIPERCQTAWTTAKANERTLVVFMMHMKLATLELAPVGKNTWTTAAAQSPSQLTNTFWHKLCVSVWFSASLEQNEPSKCGTQLEMSQQTKKGDENFRHRNAQVVCSASSYKMQAQVQKNHHRPECWRRRTMCVVLGATIVV